MNKNELHNDFSAKLDTAGFKHTKKDASAIFEMAMELVASTLLANGEVSLGKIGKLAVIDRAERKARNLQTQKEIIVPATKVTKLRVSKNFKHLVAQS